jgi:hypothetical protein
LRKWRNRRKNLIEWMIVRRILRWKQRKKAWRKKERLSARIDAIVTEIKRIQGGIRKLK